MHAVDGELHDEQEGAQYSDDQVVIGDAVSKLAAIACVSAGQRGQHTMTTTPWELYMAGSWQQRKAPRRARC